MQYCVCHQHWHTQRGVINMKTFYLKSYSNWRIAGIVVSLLKVIFNVYFGHYFELLLSIVHLPLASIYDIIIGKNDRFFYQLKLWKKLCFVFNFKLNFIFRNKSVVMCLLDRWNCDGKCGSFLDLAQPISYFFSFMFLFPKENTMVMLTVLFWWTLIMGPFLWLAIFDAIYDNENYAVRLNPFYVLTCKSFKLEILFFAVEISHFIWIFLQRLSWFAIWLLFCVTIQWKKMRKITIHPKHPKFLKRHRKWWIHLCRHPWPKILKKAKWRMFKWTHFIYPSSKKQKHSLLLNEITI